MLKRPPRLYSIPFSPWSEKARWALDHHRVDYEVVEHLLLVGDLRLRVLLRKPTGRVTVPVLDDGGVLFTDSWDIARHADTIGAGPRLFPPGKEAEIEAWNRRAEAAASAARAMMVLKVVDEPEAAKAMLPRQIPEGIAPLVVPVARGAMALFAAKYRMRDGAGSHLAAAEEALDAIDAALAHGRDYLIGDALTYADITVACALQGVSPVDKRFMPIGPGGRASWTHPELSARYPRLFAWRDALYEKHRRTA
jgi:glutathione S-transferase